MFFLKKIEIISGCLLTAFLLVSISTTSYAQNSIRNKHNLGLFNEIASDTISDGTGGIYGSTEHLQFNLLSDATEKPILGDTRSSAALDIDNDGDIDLLLGSTTRYPIPSTLLLNDGTEHFTISQNSGLPDYISSFVCGDINNDNFTDLIVVGAPTYNSSAYIDSKMKRPRINEFKIQPWSYKIDCFINNGDGTFSNKQTSFTDYYGYTPPSSMTLSDINCDGFLDFVSLKYNEPKSELLTWIYDGNDYVQNNFLELPFHKQEIDRSGIISIFDINNDKFPDLLFHNNPSFFGVRTKTYQLINDNGKFSKAELSAYPDDPKFVQIVQLDIDNDLDFDAITSMTDAHGSRTPLYLNDNGTFKNIGKEAGLWFGYKVCAGFTTGDLDNDSYIDLLPFLHGSYSTPTKFQLFRNLGDNRFSTSFDCLEPRLPCNSSKNILIDIDGDMDLDIIIPQELGYSDKVTVESSKLLIYRNDSKTGNAIMFDLRGTKSNRSAIGARIIVKDRDLSMIRLVEKPPFITHFGIAEKTKIESVRVEWPSGLNEVWHDMPANKIWVLIEGSGEIDH